MALRTKKRLEIRIGLTSASVLAVFFLQYYLAQNDFFQDSANYTAKDSHATAPDQLIFYAFILGLLVVDAVYIYHYVEYMRRVQITGHKLMSNRKKKKIELHVD